MNQVVDRRHVDSRKSQVFDQHVIELRKKDPLTKLTITTMKINSDNELFMETACILMTGSRSLVTIRRIERDRSSVKQQTANLKLPNMEFVGYQTNIWYTLQLAGGGPADRHRFF